MELFALAGRIVLNDGGITSKLENINSKARSTGSTFDDVFGRIKSAALKLGGALLGGMGLKEVFDEANESQEAMAQMNAVLKSTGDASGMTKQSLVELAEAQGKTTEYSKTAVEQGENILLTFTNIGKSVFPQTTVACENMATAMHMDLNSACLTVGKALQDPVKGVTALQREGVKLTDSQKKTVAAMVKTGNVAGAQKIILGELNKEFGNSAKAAGETFPGKLKILKHSLLDVGAGIMEKLMPPIQNAVNFINAHMPQIQAVISKVINTITPFIGPIISDIGQIASNLLPHLGSSAQTAGGQVLGLVKGGLTALKAVLDWMATHGAAVKVAILGIGGAFATFKTVSAVTGTISKIKSGFDKVTKAAGKVKGKIGDVSTALSLVKDIKKPSDFFALINSSGKMDGFNSKIGKVGSAFGSLGSKVTGLGSKMGGVLLNGLKKVGSGFKSLFALMAANPISIVIVAIVALVATLVILYNKNKAFRDLVNNVWNGIKSFFSGLPAFFSGLWSSITSAATNFWNSIVGFFTQSIPAFIDSVGQWFQQLPYNIGYALGTAVKAVINFGTSLWDWVTGTLPQIIQGIIKWFQQLPGRIWNFLTTTIDNIGTWGGNMLQAAGKAAQDTVNGIINWFQQLPGKMLDIGKNIITGIWNGITGAGNWLKDKIGGFCNGIVSGFKDALKIHSPSRVFADEVGKFMALGIGQGFTDNMQSVSDKMTAAMGAATSGLSVGVKAQLQPAFAGGYAAPISTAASSASMPCNFYQYNYSPKALSPAETARQTRNLFRQARLQSRK